MDIKFEFKSRKCALLDFIPDFHGMAHFDSTHVTYQHAMQKSFPGNNEKNVRRGHVSIIQYVIEGWMANIKRKHPSYPAGYSQCFSYKIDQVLSNIDCRHSFYKMYSDNKIYD